MDSKQGCDLFLDSKNKDVALVYSKIKRAYRLGGTSIAIETESGLRVLLRKNCGLKFSYVDEWQYIPEVDAENRPGKYYSYTMRGQDSAPLNYKDKDKFTGKYRWMRLKSHKIEEKID